MFFRKQNSNEGSHRARGSALVNLQLIIVVEAGAMPCVSHDEAGAVVVHATLATTHKQMRCLAERRGAVQERRRQ